MKRQTLQLGFGVLLASAALTSPIQAQGIVNDSNASPGVLVSLRSQTSLLVTQQAGLELNQQPAAQTDEKKDGTGKDDEVKSAAGAPATGAQSEAGRLNPITMESVRAPIGAANISVTDIGTKVLPDDQAAKQMVPRLPLPSGQDRAFSGMTYRWQAANICHLPLYFEEPMLERNGQQCCPTWIQPAVSGSKFLSNLLLYPYKATLHPALENRYTLGHFRPGSSAPCLRDSLPWSTDAALVQAGATTAVVVGLPW